MSEIYTTKESQMALTVFQIFSGSGEYFDLNTKPITKERFSFGNLKILNDVYFININCIGYNICVENSPQNCINTFKISYKTEQNHCLHCGRCKENCLSNAVERMME